MAYMVDCEGPYPNKVGEFCGNHLPGEHVYAMFGMNQAEAEYNRAYVLSKMRFGRPRPEREHSTATLESIGIVGLYLKEDESWFLRPGRETEVPTPPELTEPAAAGE